MTQSRINVAVQGTGMSATIFHLPLLEALTSQFNIHTIISRSRKEPLDRYPTARIVSNFEEAINNPEIDLVVLTGPNSTHYPLVIIALKAGKNIVVEKPFTISVDMAEDITNIVRETGLLCAVYHNRRFDSDYKTVKKILPCLGKILEVESNFDRDRSLGNDGWREDPEEPGSGVLYDLGSHLIDQALDLFGEPKTVTGFVMHQTKFKADDYFHIILQYEEGPIVHLRCECLHPRLRPRFLVHGTTGDFLKYGMDVQEHQLKEGILPLKSSTFGVEPTELWGSLFDGPSGKQTIISSEKGTYIEFYEKVARAINLKAPLGDRAEEVGLVSAFLASKVIRIIYLAKKSSDEGRTLAYRN